MPGGGGKPTQAGGQSGGGGNPASGAVVVLERRTGEGEDEDLWAQIRKVLALRVMAATGRFEVGMNRLTDFAFFA